MFNVIHADNPSVAGHLERLRAAFAAIDDREQQYNEMVQGIQSGDISLYHLKAEGVDLSLAGEIDGPEYFIWAVAGKGLKAGIEELASRVKEIGLDSITCATGSRSAARLYRQRLGAVTTRREFLDSGGFVTWHRLEV